MATPKPGEIRCPTCHRSTPPAAYCTQCGSAIPSDARARPRGMDRDELQERIRARRIGGEPYRRGSLADEGYERFEPEPEDERAARGAEAIPERRPDYFDDATAPVPPPPPIDRRELTRETDDWTAPIPDRSGGADVSDVPSATVDEPYAAASAEGAPIGPSDEEYQEYDDAPGYPYEYDAWEDPHERRSGAGAFAIIGFLALGVLALLSGAVLAGVFNGGGGPVAQESPSQAVVESVAPSASAAPSVEPSAEASAEASLEPPASGEPVVFPDGFVAQAQPCIPGSVRSDGCDSNGAVNGGQVEIWVGFQNGNSDDVIGTQIIGPDGNTVGEGTIPLADIGCASSCNGYTWFNFPNLQPGEYEVRVTRNGQPASTTGFEVT
ncbi:MAG TPA: hypothetical protein VHR55_06665 [Candidatus Limnocylindria bacterium]|nr:hypothetical protein [Candidatus Limnocylindria bacterium]